jgi:hypothetical protein
MLFEGFFFGAIVLGPSFEECYEANPAFVKQDGQKLVFKELQTGKDIGIDLQRQMYEKYRACLVADGINQEKIMLIDSVLLR